MKKFYMTLFFIVLATFHAGILLAQVYVTESGAGLKDGTSWSNAYDKNQLQLAITNATSGKQIWVAKGTYVPTVNPVASSSDNRDKAFLMKRGVSLYGGFAGNEPANYNLSNRDFAANRTILSGDLNGNDILDVDHVDYAAKKTDNAYHVIIVHDAISSAVTSRLDGFTLSGGYADGTTDASVTVGSTTYAYHRGKGGGITTRGVGAYNLQYHNCTIENNHALPSTEGGGGAYFYASAATGTSVTYVVQNSLFSNNRSSLAGGAIYVYRSQADPHFNLSGVSFKNNIAAGGSGGAVYYLSSTTTLTLTNAIFESNNAGNNGGALYLSLGAAAISQSTFKSNTSASSGAAVYLASNTESNISTSSFIGNIAGLSGGAIFNYIGTAKVSKCKFYSNEASSGAGAIQGSSSTSTSFSINNVANSVFYNNISYASAGSASGVGAIYINTYAEGTIVNSTFYRNKSVGKGYGVLSFNNLDNTRVNIYNSIFNDNMEDYDEASDTGDFVDIRRGTGAVQDYANNLFQSAISTSNSRTVTNAYVLNENEPLFLSEDANQANFLLLVQGAATERGNNTLVPVVALLSGTDLNGNPRLVHANIDLGAFEYQGVLPVSVHAFKAALINGKAQLKWSVGVEDNVSHYVIERSLNGIDFIKIAQVKANGSVAYLVNDMNLVPGLIYYRLVTVDNDGTESRYAELQSVKVAPLSSTFPSAYPNPIKNAEINVSLSGTDVGVYAYQLVAASGNVVQRGRFNYAGAPVLLRLPATIVSGVYMLYVTNGTQSFTVKLIKQ